MRSRVASQIGLVIRPFPQVDVTSDCKSNGHFAGRMETTARIDRKPMVSADERPNVRKLLATGMISN
jgi:hypothetical protein